MFILLWCVPSISLQDPNPLATNANSKKPAAGAIRDQPPITPDGHRRSSALFHQGVQCVPDPVPRVLQRCAGYVMLPLHWQKLS